eukprot:gnl/Chilomastix_cuspidata/2318.p1 GENE.gnl/Chilomastix_cuspidata/2318~~gnl/Chilomastix_cuspidata/2318.p1  ORF type:complete len:259 (+),score=42.95 gnl/Chilomastix_cuspidata/2318:25-777(+)
MSSQVVSLKTSKGRYELLVKPQTVRLFRKKELGMSKVLITDTIFTDAKKGDAASLEAVLADLEVESPNEALEFILMRGHYDLTTAERAMMVEEKRNQIIAHIHMNFTDPTGKPVPRVRVENALKSLKGLKIDPFIEANLQAPGIVKLVKRKMPLKSALMEGTITIPWEHYGKVENYIQTNTTVVRTKQGDTGCEFSVSVAPGTYDSLMKNLGGMCKGYFTADFGLASEPSPAPTGGSRKGKGKARRRGRP